MVTFHSFPIKNGDFPGGFASRCWCRVSSNAALALCTATEAAGAKASSSFSTSPATMGCHHGRVRLRKSGRIFVPGKNLELIIILIYNLFINYNIIILYPPTPAVSRGSASEEALLATRCQKGRRVCAERKPAPGGHKQGGSWQCRNAGKVKVWS